MIRIGVVIAVLLLTTRSVYSQQRVEKCSLPVVTEVKSHLMNLVAEDVKVFLLTFDQVCLSDQEYTVNSNELLFMILEDYPDLMLKSMYDNRNQIDLRSIYYQFSHPANAKYDVAPLIEKVQQATSYGSINSDVIAELQRIPK